MVYLQTVDELRALFKLNATYQCYKVVPKGEGMETGGVVVLTQHNWKITGTVCCA